MKMSLGAVLRLHFELRTLPSPSHANIFHVMIVSRVCGWAVGHARLLDSQSFHKWLKTKTQAGAHWMHLLELWFLRISHLVYVFLESRCVKFRMQTGGIFRLELIPALINSLVC